MQNKKTSAAKRALGAKTASLAGNLPNFEHIVIAANETFLWRIDDYPWERNVWNFHPEIEIHLIRKASGMAFVGDYIGEFNPGYLTVVGPNLPHDWVTATEPGEVIHGRDIVIQFDAGRILEIAATLPEVVQLQSFLALCERGLVFHGTTRTEATEIMEAMETASGFARLTLFFQLLQVLSSSESYEVLASPDFAPKLDVESLDTLHRSLIYIFEHFATDIHLSEVATRAGMNESAFSRFFKKNTGNSFTDHVNKLRIWHACKLLSETDMQVTDICFEVGYLNISHFNRTFLRHHKVTPSKYRRLTSQRRPSRSVDAQQKSA